MTKRDDLLDDPVALARRFHELYEELAPHFDRPWRDHPRGPTITTAATSS